jgi:hypothetical protein
MIEDLLPEHWKQFAFAHSLVGKEVEFPWPGEDGLMAVIEILDDIGVENEARRAYPGIVVFSDGFVPIGACSIGTGDPYLINLHDGPYGPIYKIDHAQVHNSGYNRETAVTKMLESYRDLLNYVST